MCDLKEQYLQAFENEDCSGTLTKDIRGDISVKGRVSNSLVEQKVKFWAAAPANHGQSFTGSALPFANPEMAYENSPNKGIVMTNNGEFELKLFMPNAFYIDLGSTYVPPHVNIEICRSGGNKTFAVQLGEGIPYRTLTFCPPPTGVSRTSPEFYKSSDRADVRTQEQIIRSYAYPKDNKYAKDYWGGKPH
jgi:hypothetical protein